MRFLIDGMCITFPAFVRVYIMFIRSADPNHFLQLHLIQMETFSKPPLPFISHELCPVSQFNHVFMPISRPYWRIDGEGLLFLGLLQETYLWYCFLTSFSSRGLFLFYLVLSFKVSQIWPDDVFISLQVKNFAGAMVALALRFCWEVYHYTIIVGKFNFFFLILRYQDLPLFTWKMNAMLRMQFGRFTGHNLAGMGIIFVLSGRSKNVVVEGLAVKEDHQSAQNLQRLYVINFDPINTRMRDLERHFEPYVNDMNVRIRRNFAFIQFELQDDATKALQATNMRYAAS